MTRRLAWMSLAAVLALSGPARADDTSASATAADNSTPPTADGGGWSWPEGTTRRYLVESVAVLPRIAWIISRNNHEGRIGAFQVRAVVTCSSRGPLKRGGWSVACEIDELAVAVSPVEQDTGKLEPIVAEYEALLRDARVEFELSQDGRLHVFDLEGVPKDDFRSVTEHEQLRQLMMRGFAGLDLAVERTILGAAWVQDDTMVIQLPSDKSTISSIELTHRVVDVSGALVGIRTTGDGAFSFGSEDARFHVHLDSDAVFDAESGALVERTWWAAAVPGVSTVIGDVSVAGSSGLQEASTVPVASLTYLQGGQLRLLDPDEVVDMGTTGEGTLGDSAATDALLVASNVVDDIASRVGPRIAFSGWFLELGSGVLLRDGFDNTVAAELRAGGRTARGLWLGGGLAGSLPTTFPVVGLSERQRMDDFGLTTGVWWNPDWRVAPRLGAAMIVAFRHFPGAEPAWVALPTAGPDVGLHVGLPGGLQVGGSARLAMDWMRIKTADGLSMPVAFSPWTATYGVLLTWSGGAG